MTLSTRVSLTLCLTLGKRPCIELMIVQYLRGQSSEAFVRGNDLKLIPTDELWNLHDEVVFELAQKLQAEKTKLDQRLHQLRGTDKHPYPPVLPKYRNPKNPTETWSGRGKQPRWLGPLIQAGRRLDDFLIDRAARRSAVRNATPTSTTTNGGSRSSVRALRR
jgi:DNA-binding protein H-NS